MPAWTAFESVWWGENIAKLHNAKPLNMSSNDYIRKVEFNTKNEILVTEMFLFWI